jgi:hypothetical protein
LLSRKYNPEYYKAQLVRSNALLMVAFCGSFYVGMKQQAFFQKCRYKYFKQLSDKDLVHFDDKMAIEKEQRDDRLKQLQNEASI